MKGINVLVVLLSSAFIHAFLRTLACLKTGSKNSLMSQGVRAATALKNILPDRKIRKIYSYLYAHSVCETSFLILLSRLHGEEWLLTNIEQKSMLCTHDIIIGIPCKLPVQYSFL